MKKKSLCAKNWLILALVLIFLGSCGAGLVQSDFGRVKIVDITLQTDSGTLTGYLLIPNTASSEAPAPAVVTCHGYLNSREMQDLNYVELARRGYVVFAMSYYGHGDSSVAGSGGSEISLATGGMADVVEYLSGLNFVDSARIGVTGHSMGSYYTGLTAAYYSQLEADALAAGLTDEEAHALNKVAAAMLIAGVPIAENSYLCEIGFLEGRFDEFYNATYNTSFFGALDSAAIKDVISTLSGEPVTETIIEGKRYINPLTGYGVRMWSPWQIHAWNHFSKECCSYTLEFFDDALGAPKPIASNNQIWQFKEFLNSLSLIGFFMLIVPLAELLLGTKYFGELRLAEAVPLLAKPKKKAYLVTNLCNSILAGVLVLPLLAVGYLFMVNRFWPQDTTGGIALWSLVCGLLTLLFLRLSGIHPFRDANSYGVKISARRLGKTVLLAFCVICMTYSTVFLADWLFQVDFRLWVLGVRVFSASKAWVALKYLPCFLVFYLANSLAVSRNRFEGWSERKQIFVSCLWNVLGIVLLLVLQYGCLLVNGMTFFGTVLTGLLATGGALFPLLMFPVIPLLCVAAAVGVKLYRQTGNIYLGGFINAMLITMITVANTSFTYPY